MPLEHEKGCRRVFERMAERPAAAGLLTDFDGTLSAVVPEPVAARPLPGAVDLLHRLADRFAVVAVVSGRSGSFLVEHLRLDQPGCKVRASGIYGLEDVGAGGTIEAREDARGWRALIEDAVRTAGVSTPDGVIVENKGLALTFHWRQDPGGEEWSRLTARRLCERLGLVPHQGKMSVELRPPVPVDKGTAVSALARGLEAVCYLGDDVGDLPAYAALDALAEEGVSTCKVAAIGPEVPPEVVAAADLTVPGPEGALALLHRLEGAAAPS